MHLSTIHLEFQGSLSATLHQIGLVVLIHTSEPTMWFDVETRPSNDDGSSAILQNMCYQTSFCGHNTFCHTH